MSDCATHLRAVTIAQEATPAETNLPKNESPPMLHLPTKTAPKNNGYMPYAFTVYRWNMHQVQNQAAMERDFLAIFEQCPGVYPYWFADADGLTLVAAIPNTVFQQNRDRKNIIVGLEELCESEGIATAEKTMTTDADRQSAAVALTRLYDNGYVLCKKTDMKAKP